MISLRRPFELISDDETGNLYETNYIFCQEALTGSISTDLKVLHSVEDSNNIGLCGESASNTCE